VSSEGRIVVVMIVVVMTIVEEKGMARATVPPVARFWVEELQEPRSRFGIFVGL
jgi:hypothetical protein